LSETQANQTKNITIPGRYLADRAGGSDVELNLKPNVRVVTIMENMAVDNLLQLILKLTLSPTAENNLQLLSYIRI
jgi:hypothetical protein